MAAAAADDADDSVSLQAGPEAERACQRCADRAAHCCMVLHIFVHCRDEVDPGTISNFNGMSWSE